MKREEIIAGGCFGKWEVLSPPIRIDGVWKAECKCKCGTQKLVRCINLLSKTTNSCGQCDSFWRTTVPGTIFGRLTVIGYPERTNKKWC